MIKIKAQAPLEKKGAPSAFPVNRYAGFYESGCDHLLLLILSYGSE